VTKIVIPNSKFVSSDVRETDAGSSVSTSVTRSHVDVAVLAYQLWEARGCPEGSPEIDWYEAERAILHLSEGTTTLTTITQAASA
jgi:hypothetical protein